MVASNDGTAGGVVAALTAQGMEGIPVSGQDGDKAALNRIALGTQTVSVWKDARELGKAAGEIAVALAGGTALDAVEGAAKFTSPGGNEMNSILLTPIADHPGQPRTSWSTPAGSPRTRSAPAFRPAPRRLRLNARLERGRPASRPSRTVSQAGPDAAPLAQARCASLEIDLRLLGMIGGARRHLAGASTPSPAASS